MKIGFVGTGHMGGSIALALHNSGHELLLHNRTEAKAQALCGRLGACAKVATLGEAVDCDYVFVGVKPKDVEGLLQDPAWATCPGVIVSMVAGLPIAKLQGYLPAKPLIRILPNTPVAVGQGLTLAVYGEGVSEAKRAEFAALYVPTGKLAIVKEDELDSASVLTGSAPAYLDYFVDALIQAGVALGLDPAAANPEKSASAVTEPCELFIPLGELVDVEKELKRLAKDLKGLEGEIARAEKMLSNPGFVNKAPAQLVESEKEKLNTNRGLLEKLKARIAEMESLR